jgi:hypothetical protein
LLTKTGKFADENIINHCFIHTIKTTKEMLKVTDDKFKNWMLKVSHGFEQKNYWALERRLVHSMDGVNPRCVLDELSSTQKLSCHTNAEVLNLKRKLDDVSTELADTKMIFRSELGMMNTKTDCLLNIIERGGAKNSINENDTKYTTTSMQYNQGEFHMYIM